MTIHAHTDQGAGCPAYINISERVSNPGDVVVTVRSAGENHSSAIILSRYQLRDLVSAAHKYLEDGDTQTETAQAPQATVDVKKMVDRFLRWRLPETFGPDSFVTFDRARALQSGSWPIGTNLLTAIEAQVMFEHALRGRES